jgi:hypothetical protein
MIPRRTADQAEREATRDVTYYGSTTTGSTPAIQQRQIQPTPPPIAPSFDFSDAAINARRWDAIQRASDELAAKRAIQRETPMGWLGAEPERLGLEPRPGDFTAIPQGLSLEEKTPTAAANRAYIAYTLALQDQKAKSLEKYPTLLAGAIEAGIDERELAQLVNFVAADQAAEKVVAAMMLIAGSQDGTYYGSTTTGDTPTMPDPDRVKLGNYQIDSIMRSANPIMQMAIWDVVADKIQEIEAPGGTEASSWADWIVERVGAGLDWLFTPFVVANEAVMQGIRAGSIGYQFEETTPYGPFSVAQNIVEYWDKVQDGNYDTEIVAATRQEYGDLAVDLVLSVEDRARNGDPDPLISLFAERSGDPEAMRIIQQMLYKDGSSDIDIDAVARSLENGNLGNTGQLLVTGILGDEWLGSVGRGNAAALANVTVTLAADPTIVGTKIRSAYVASRFALEQIAPGATRLGVKNAFQLRPTRRYFDNLFRDLNRYDDLVGKDAGKAAVFREQIRRRYAEIPDNVIDTLRSAGVRTTDDMAEWVFETNQMYLMAKGKVATGIISGGDEAVTGVRALVPEMLEAGQALTRAPLLPRMGVTRRAKMNFANAVSMAMPKKRGQTVIDEVYGGAASTSEFVETISDVSNVARAGQIERGLLEEPGRVGKNLDRFFKMFGSVGMGYVNIVDGRDAKTIYRFARNYLSRRHSAYWADRWRDATPGQRYDMLVGLTRTAAAAKGINLADETMLARVDELVTATRTTTSFSAKSAPIRPAGTGPIPEEDWSIPSRFSDGTEKALFDWQTASHVALPNVRDMDKLGRWQRLTARAGVIGEGIVASPQAITDAWSLGTLFGLRYSVRNAIEDLWFYAVLTGGSFKDLYKGRRMSTMLRETRGRKRVTAFSKKEQQALGMVNRRARKLGDHLEESQIPLFNSISNFIRGNLDQSEVATAHAAARKGDFEPMQRLAATAMARSRFAFLSDAEKTYLLDLVDGPFGLKLLDDLAETGRTASSGGFIDEAVAISATDTPGVGLGTLPRTAEGKELVPVGDYTPTLPLDKTLPESYLYWERGLNGVLNGDGPAGRIAVAWLDQPEEAVRRVADEIRNDPTGRGYQWRFAALADESPEAFAARKVQAVRAMFSDANGDLNMDLWRRVVSPDRTVRAFKETEEGVREELITIPFLKSIPREKRPAYVSGQQWGAVEYPTGLQAFFDRSWGWMGEQYARISREPIFLANYISHRKVLADYQSQLAAELGDRAASKIVTKMATDRAYSFSLSYMDNPQNRSLLAYKVRNVSRYYRATEDFYRRAMRVGKNYPVGLWKTALLYDTLDDTGFVFTDDQGQKYFMYPGTSQLIEGVNTALGYLFGVDNLPMPQPNILGGRINMLTPSWDPNQAAPYLAGPYAVASYKMLARRFPSMSRLDRVFLGEYGDSQTGSTLDVLWESFAPAGMLRVLDTLDQDERESMFAAARADALKMAIANGLFPEDMTPEEFQNSEQFAELVRALDVQAVAALTVRFGMSWIVPASPQRFNDNVTDFARRHGIVGLRPGFLQLVKKHEEAGDENFLGMALADWFQLNPNLFPYTVSKTEAATRGVRPPIKTARSVNDWVNTNPELLKKYPDTAWYLAPQDPGFDFSTWSMLLASGFRVSKALQNEDGTMGPLLRDMLAARGELQHNATVADFQADIDQLDVRVPEQAEQIKALEDERDALLEMNRDQNPWWGKKYAETRNPVARNQVAQDALTEVKRMVDNLYAETPEPEFENSSAYWLRTAVYTYLDFAADIRSIEGRDRDSVERKKALEYELGTYLDYIGEQSPNADLFIRNVLRSNPDIGSLDLNPLGVGRG